MQLSTQQKSPFLRNHLLRDAIAQALCDAMGQDKSIQLFGEGAAVKVHYDAPAIEKDFSDRVHTLPISEDGNSNFCVGTSLLGVKPVVDVITADFLYRTMDSICNTCAKLNFVLGQDREPSTIVIRSEFMVGGPTTGQRPEALFAHIPGLRVVIPSTPRDAYGLMRTALATPGVTLFFEDRMIDDAGPWTDEDLRVGDIIPMGASLWRRRGGRGNCTIITYGIMRQIVERILESSEVKDKYDDESISSDVVDLRTIYPIDWDGIFEVLKGSGRLLMIEPDIRYGGIGAEIAATVVERKPYIKVKRLGAPRITIPASPSLHRWMLPNEEDITNAIKAMRRA